MKRLLLLLLLATPALADEDDYLISEDDAWEAKSYNERRGDLTADFDQDGTPNFLDPMNDNEHLPKWMQDWDSDKIQNWIDPYDDGQFGGELD